jgi:hypothetical protein
LAETNTLAYKDTVIVTIVKSLILDAAGESLNEASGGKI